MGILHCCCRFEYSSVRTFAMRRRAAVSGDTAAALADYAESSAVRSEEHTSELQSRENLVCRLLLEKKKPLRRVESGLQAAKPAAEMRVTVESVQRATITAASPTANNRAASQRPHRPVDHARPTSRC